MGRQPKWQTVKVIGKGDFTHDQQFPARPISEIPLPITGEQINLEAAWQSGFSLHQQVRGGNQFRVAVESCAIPPFRILTKRVLLHSDNGVNGALYQWRVFHPGECTGNPGSAAVTLPHCNRGSVGSRRLQMINRAVIDFNHNR
jgi:hypothetical protein